MPRVDRYLSAEQLGAAPESALNTSLTSAIFTQQSSMPTCHKGRPAKGHPGALNPCERRVDTFTADAVRVYSSCTRLEEAAAAEAFIGRNCGVSSVRVAARRSTLSAWRRWSRVVASSCRVGCYVTRRPPLPGGAGGGLPRRPFDVGLAARAGGVRPDGPLSLDGDKWRA